MKKQKLTLLVFIGVAVVLLVVAMILGPGIPRFVCIVIAAVWVSCSLLYEYLRIKKKN
jgi:hypothetical protein